MEKQQTFNDMIIEEIINTMVNVYDYNEDEAMDFAKLHSMRIEAEMWDTFDYIVRDIMKDKLKGR